MPVHIPSYAYAAFKYHQYSVDKWTTQSIHKSLPDITGSTFEAGLSILGEYGWDLAGSVPILGDSDFDHFLVFKRPGDKPAHSEPSRFAQLVAEGDEEKGAG